jgi:probable phosphoglycerate mutase
MLSQDARPSIWLIRHGETEWSRSGAHTGRTDIPLTAEGERQAAAIARCLAGRPFALVLTSPLSRARETCRLAGYANVARLAAELVEWDYGAYEGRTSAEIQPEVPDWTVWTSRVPQGETIQQVAERARQVIGRSLAAGGDVALFAHGHILRVLTACWLELPPEAGRLFALGTSSLSKLGYERDTRVITQWNYVCCV